MERNARLAKKLLENRRTKLVKVGPVYRARGVTAAAPGQGPYYWIPTPGGSWELWAYVVGREDDIPDHSKYWRVVVASRLAELWNKNVEDIRELPYGMPRGRVSYFDKIYYLNHGGDSPDPNWKEKILKEYGLLTWSKNRSNQLKIYIDGHEKMLDQERVRLASVLGISSDTLPVSERTQLWD